MAYNKLSTNKWKVIHVQGQNNRFCVVRAINLFCPHTAATSPAGSPGSAGATVESATSEPSTEVAGTPPEEQTTRYVDRQIGNLLNPVLFQRVL